MIWSYDRGEEYLKSLIASQRRNMKKTSVEVEVILKVSGIASFLPGSIKDTVCHDVAIDITNYCSSLIQQELEKIFELRHKCGLRQ